MTIVIDLLYEVLAYLPRILGILGAIQAAQQWVQLFQNLGNIVSQLNTIQGVVQTGATNNEQSFSSVENDINALAGAIASLRLQVGQPQQYNVPVRLPPTPPPGYGGPSRSDIGDAVWLYALPNARPFTALEAQDSMMAHFYIAAGNQVSYQLFGNQGYRVTGLDGEVAANFSGPNQSALDFSTIRPTDASIFAWANRVYPSSPWAHGPGTEVYERDSANVNLLWIIDLTDLEFKQWQAGFAGSAARTAPVWPGLSNVTLGTAVALANQMILTGPMDGVIVHLTSVPTTKTSYFFATTEHDWFRIGALTFRNDHGEEEPPQLLGFDHAVYCARQMQHAASCLVRLQGAVTGTIQPWTMN